MASNVIGQQDGSGKFVFTNIDNRYGGATTTLLTLEDGKVSFDVPVEEKVMNLTIPEEATTAELNNASGIILLKNLNTDPCTLTIAPSTVSGQRITMLLVGGGADVTLDGGSVLGAPTLSGGVASFISVSIPEFGGIFWVPTSIYAP